MKKIILGFIAVMYMMICIPCAVHASIIDSGEFDNLTWTYDNNGVLTISGEGKMRDWDSIVRAPWFDYKDRIKTVVIEDGVTNIGDRAFFLCSSLKSIFISNSVTSISSGFESCTSLIEIDVDERNEYYCSENGILFDKYKTSLIAYPAGKTGVQYSVPDSVIYIGNYAFCDCSALTSIKIPDSVTSIGNRAFSNCSSLTSVNLPNSVTSIGVATFEDCSALTSIVIPYGITSINGLMFYGCRSLTSIDIPDSVISIDDRAFEHCTDLANITIPNSVMSIGYDVFYYCSSLTSITIPDSVTNIGYGIFDSCSSLTSVEIGSGITSISNSMFYFCSSLMSITIPDSVMNIGGAAFYGCHNLSDVYYGGSKGDWDDIDIGEYGNENLLNASIHYNAVGANLPVITTTQAVSAGMGIYEVSVSLEGVEYDSRIIAVTYGGGAVTGASFETISVGDTEKTITIKAETADTAKVFIWDSLNSMRPLCPAAEVLIN